MTKERFWSFWPFYAKVTILVILVALADSRLPGRLRSTDEGGTREQGTVTRCAGRCTWRRIRGCRIGAGWWCIWWCTGPGWCTRLYYPAYRTLPVHPAVLVGAVHTAGHAVYTARVVPGAVLDLPPRESLVIPAG